MRRAKRSRSTCAGAIARRSRPSDGFGPASAKPDVLGAEDSIPPRRKPIRDGENDSAAAGRSAESACDLHREACIAHASGIEKCRLCSVMTGVPAPRRAPPPGTSPNAGVPSAHADRRVGARRLPHLRTGGPRRAAFPDLVVRWVARPNGCTVSGRARGFRSFGRIIVNQEAPWSSSATCSP